MSRPIFLLALALMFATSSAGLAQRKVTSADMPRIPATEAKDALKTFKLARGCRLELVAAEPLVADPVAACFDEHGRMFVAEMHGYPFSQEPTQLNPKGGGKKDAGIIRLLEDTDGDGKMDKSFIFADKISWPTSVCCYNGGIFVIAPQYLYYFKDTDGDNKADVREVVLRGFGRNNVQSVANGLKWRLDNKIYFAAGRNPKKLLHRGKALFASNGSDLRFDPKSEQFERVTGGLQFGHSMDNWGNRFVCSNSNHIQQVVYPSEYLSRNPQLAVSRLIQSIAADGASARVFRTSPPEPWRIIRQKWRAEAKGYKLILNEDGSWSFEPLDPSKKKGVVPTEYPVGFFTSATGITIYRGGAYPEAFRENAFVGDVGGNLVHRKTVKLKGVTYTAQRADAGEEIIRSSDNWFRPVNFVNAPDGTLYVLDMYRETVEHPYSIPDEIKKFLHLYSGHDRGRIYRLVPSGMKRLPIKNLGKLSTPQLVEELNSANSWNRETAQRLLWERQAKDAAELLTARLASARPTGRVHILWTLQGIGAITVDHVVKALKDEHPRVREQAVKLSERVPHDSDALLSGLLKLADDPDMRVRFQLAFTLGSIRSPRALDGIVMLARNPFNSSEVRTALLSSVAGKVGEVGQRLLSTKRIEKHVSAIVGELCLLAGADKNTNAATQLLLATTRPNTPAATQQLVLTSLGEGLSRRGSTMESIYGQLPKSVNAQIKASFVRAISLATSEKASLVERAASIGTLAYARSSLLQEAFDELLSPRSPQALQRATVAAIAKHADDELGQSLIEHWRAFSPQVRRDATDALLSSAKRITILFEAVDKKRLRLSDLARDQKQTLLNHPNKSVQARSKQLFGKEVNSDRAKVVAKLQPVLNLDGNAQRGAKVFQKTCSTCHRVGNVGHQVAPDLASVKNKSESDLLIAILDPNRESQPNFNTYNVRTENGRVYNGIVAAETATSITLRRAEGKQDVILRSNIDAMIATGKSLMPEGLEKELKPQDIADIIAFIKKVK